METNRAAYLGNTCFECRKGKVRCDRQSPCSRCIKHGLECVAQSRGRGRPCKEGSRSWKKKRALAALQQRGHVQKQEKVQVQEKKAHLQEKSSSLLSAYAFVRASEVVGEGGVMTATTGPLPSSTHSSHLSPPLASTTLPPQALAGRLPPPPPPPPLHSSTASSSLKGECMSRILAVVHPLSSFLPPLRGLHASAAQATYVQVGRRNYNYMMDEDGLLNREEGQLSSADDDEEGGGERDRREARRQGGEGKGGCTVSEMLAWRNGSLDQVITTANQAWDDIMGGLIEEGRCERRRFKSVLGLFLNFAKRDAPGRDPGAGLIRLLREGLVKCGPIPTSQNSSPVIAAPIPGPVNLYQRLTADEEACYLIEESLHGRRFMQCNQRMSDMFLSNEELEGVLHQTGLLVSLIMMRILATQQDLINVSRVVSSIALDSRSKNCIDFPVKCRTRSGEIVRCLGTIGIFLNYNYQSVFIFRLWPLGVRPLTLLMQDKAAEEEGGREMNLKGQSIEETSSIGSSTSSSGSAVASSSSSSAVRAATARTFPSTSFIPCSSSSSSLASTAAAATALPPSASCAPLPPPPSSSLKTTLSIASFAPPPPSPSSSSVAATATALPIASIAFPPSPSSTSAVIGLTDLARFITRTATAARVTPTSSSSSSSSSSSFSSSCPLIHSMHSNGSCSANDKADTESPSIMQRVGVAASATATATISNPYYPIPCVPPLSNGGRKEGGLAGQQLQQQDQQQQQQQQNPSSSHPYYPIPSVLLPGSGGRLGQQQQQHQAPSSSHAYHSPSCSASPSIGGREERGVGGLGQQLQQQQQQQDPSTSHTYYSSNGGRDGTGVGGLGQRQQQQQQEKITALPSSSSSSTTMHSNHYINPTTNGHSATSRPDHPISYPPYPYPAYSPNGLPQVNACTAYVRSTSTTTSNNNHLTTTTTITTCRSAEDSDIAQILLGMMNSKAPPAATNGGIKSAPYSSSS